MCAEYFLSSLKDVDGDDTRGESLGRTGPPTVQGGSSGGALLARMRAAKAEAHRARSLSRPAVTSGMLATAYTHTCLKLCVCMNELVCTVAQTAQ